MIDNDAEFRRLVARERAAALAADWQHAAPPPGPRTPQRSPSGRRRNSWLPLLLERHGRHTHRVAAHRG
jgi:hypothetical protein